MIQLTRHVTKFMALICLGLLCYIPQSHATHSMGADLTYRCIGNNVYEINLSFYRDCNGIPFGSVATVNWTGSCGSGSVQLNRIGLNDITPSCPGIVGSACDSNNLGIYGIEEHLMQGILTLPAGCTDIQLSYRNCCRNLAITTLDNPGSNLLYITSSIDDAGSCNNSPTFSNVPVPFGCVGQPVFYNHGAIDPDGDQLRYSLTACQTNDSIPVSYGAGFGPSNPLATQSGVTIDPNTGAISFTPSVPQVGVLCVLVEELRNGVVIGHVVRDIQFTAVNCTNNVPVLTGINGTNSFSDTAVVGSQLCFDVFSTDPDAGQTTVVSWNNGISGASFTATGSPFQTGTFCWTPTAADVGMNTFTVTVMDDFCPVVGQNTYTFTIYVVNSSPPLPCDSIDVSIVSTSDVSCTTNDGAATILATNGVGPYTYQVVNWTTGAFFTNNTGIFTNLTPGNYSIWVADANGCTPSCVGHTFTIGGNVNPLNVTASADDVSCSSNSFNTRDSSNMDGSITVTAAGGTAPYMYTIDGINFQNTGLFTNLGVGTYNITVMDANGCSATTVATVGEPAPISISVVSLTPATCGQANGSVTLSASGGTGSFLYYINGQAQSSPTFNNLAAGTYTFSVCDMNLCVYDTTITIPGTSAFTLTASSTDPSCSGDCDGTASVQASNGAVVTVVWSNGATGQTIGNLCAGTYTATATDASGCSQTVSVVVTDPAPVSASLAASSDETCAGNDGTATISVSGGTAPYSIDLANFTVNQTYTSTSGAFTGLNAGQHIVNVTDANGCSVNCATSFSLNGCNNTTVSNNTNTVRSNSRGSSLLVNPNPAASLVQVRYQTAAAAPSVYILDGNGKIVYSKDQLNAEGSFEININDWANSTYFVVLRGQDGQVVKTTKLVISK